MDTGTDDQLDYVRQLTAMSLLHAMQQHSDDLTRMRLEDITELADEVARILPAGNVVNMVFSQLATIKGNSVSEQETRQMLGLLKQGMSTFMDKAAYLAFYSTPAILIRGYQTLLEAAGKDPQSAFPQGTWQYYLEFGLREDTARHACETRGMSRVIRNEELDVSEADQLAAWIMATAWLVTIYENLLMQEWHERMLLTQLGEHVGYPRITAKWVARRPYSVPPGERGGYVAHRQATFTRFILETLRTRMRDPQADETLHRWYQDETLLTDARHDYRKQMSLLAALEPEAFSDTKRHFDLDEASIAVQYNGSYFLIPVQHNGMRLDPASVRAMAQAILDTPAPRQRMAADEILIHIPREQQAQARVLLDDGVRANLARLRQAPIIINWDAADAQQPLGQIRQGRRGVGDHALTLFHTRRSMVFDQSHIFFDAIWGMAIAEILTNQAVADLRRMAGQTASKSSLLQPPQLDLLPAKDTARRMRKLAEKPVEVDAEIAIDIMPAFHDLRNLLRQRHPDLRLTVNDFLILYRSLYNQQYVPGQHLWEALDMVAQKGNRRQRHAARQARAALEEVNQHIPAFLIPIDASAKNPMERIYPVTFRPQPPWTNIGPQHRITWQRLHTWRRAVDDAAQTAAWEHFSETRTRYLEMLRMFGVLMGRYKEVALAGESMSTVTLKILASVPKRMQSWLSHIPDRIDLLNDMLKGTEVFSNAGRVSDDSSLTRFITAKDDNEKKVLCWGIMTRADDIMVITLRDFRPWVTALKAANVPDVAEMITEDFLAGYADGLYRYITQLTEIVQVTSQ